MTAVCRSRYLAIVLCAFIMAPAAAQPVFDTDILVDTFGFDEDTKKTVPLHLLRQGCAARDCIPSIDKPKFVAANEANHVADNDIVIALTWKGKRRAYPTKIIDHHEIVNDVIAGTPIAITWCPLCGSAVGVLRDVEGQITEFGVSGMLYNSDLVTYDRTTGTLWDQIGAIGIVGPLTGVKLDLVPVTMTRWSVWRDAHPDTMVLSTDTGFAEDYSRDRYAKYRESERIFMPLSATSNVLHPKTVVYGFTLHDGTLAVTETLLEENRSVDYEIDGRVVTMSLSDDGSVRLTDQEAGDTISPVRLFWFAWYTFHPDTDLVK